MSIVSNVKIAALQCLGSTMNTRTPSSEVSALLVKSAVENSLIKKLIQMAQNKDVLATIRAEVYGVLGNVARNYYSEFK